MIYLLLILLVYLYYLNLGFPQVWMPNESFYAYASKNMLNSGDFLTPYYNGSIRLEKPPLTYWMISLGYYLFGVNEFGLRFFHVTLGILTGLVTYFLAQDQLKDVKVSLLSALVLLSSFQFFANARYASPEMPFTFFITLSLYLWLKSYKKKSVLLLILAFTSSSLAIMTKGPAGFIIPAGVVFTYLFLNNPKELLKKRYYLLIILVILPAFWWYIFEFLFHRKDLLKMFYIENIKRIYEGNDPLYFYLLDTLVSFLPYSFLVFLALIWAFLKLRKELSFFIVWSVFVFILFSFVKSKIPVYVLPAYPAMSILTADFILNSKWEKIIKYSSTFLSLLISITILFLTFYFELEKIYITLAFLPIFFLLRYWRFSLILSGIVFLIFMNTGVLTYLESFRHYRDLGNFIKTLDPTNSLKTYEVGYFHHSLPFYADRIIIKDKIPEKKSLVIFNLRSFNGCKPVKIWELYTSSESRFVTFLFDTKSKKRFERFGVCIYNI